MPVRRTARAVIAALVLAVTLYAGARPVGPLPALGRFLDPVRGVWTVATVASMPDSAGAAVPRLAGQVQVLYDDRGVPHIFAGAIDDAIRALGFVVARERLFQLDIQTRATAGTLSELVGPLALRADRSHRTLGLAWSAEQAYAELDGESAQARALTAYADGVNAWIDDMRPRDLPFEYHLLSKSPARWEPQHALYLMKRMGWTLTYMNVERRKRAAQALVGEDAADAIFPVNHPIQEPIQVNGRNEPRFDFRRIPAPGQPDPVALREIRVLDFAFDAIRGAEGAEGAGGADGAELPPLPLAGWLGGGSAAPSAPGRGGWEVDELAPLPLAGWLGGGSAASSAPGGARGERPVGSNNWAIMPTKSAGGHAILAGDPHLDLTLPSIWYEVHLVVPGELDVYGVTIPGLPVVVIGFNRDVAWSFTNTGADVLDFYAERLDDPAEPRGYFLDGEWQPLMMRVEEFKDRSGSLIRVDTVYHTHRGPVLLRDGEALSIRWTVLEEHGETDAFFQAGRATTVDEWLDGMASYAAPAQNGVVADRNGSIAIRSTGRFPFRPGSGRGDFIQDGTTRDSDWRGSWDLRKYPFSIDPAQGYLASANQQPIDPRVDDSYFGADWPSPWRALRINELLRERSNLDRLDLQRFQTDPGSARAEAFGSAFLDAARRIAETGQSDALLAQAVALIREWDRRYTKENKRAVLFEFAMNELEWRTWDELLDPMSAAGNPRRVATPGSAMLAELLEDPTNRWWDDRRTPEIETRDDIIAASLRAGLERARSELGDENSDAWRWDHNRHTNIHHLLRIPALSALNLPVQGGPSTLNPSSGSGTHGASWRMVVELGPEVRAWSIYPGGQSGNPVSPQYMDRIEKWVDGDLDPVVYPRTADELPPGRITSKLILSPETNR